MGIGLFKVLKELIAGAAEDSRAKARNFYGERGRIRTCDPRLKRALLYHLSYAPTISIYHGLGFRDSVLVQTETQYSARFLWKIRLLSCGRLLDWNVVSGGDGAYIESNQAALIGIEAALSGAAA